MKIEISQLSKFLKIDHRNELEIWIEKIKVGLQSILLDLDATIIKQDTISRFGIVIYIQSTQYGKCYLKFVPQILERYNNEKKIYHTLHKSIMCELVKCYDEFNCLVLINCGNEVSEWDISKEEINMSDQKTLYETDPEFMERLRYFAAEEVVKEPEQQLDEVTRHLAILATLLGCQGKEVFAHLLPRALDAGVTPVIVKETVYQEAEHGKSKKEL